MGKRDDGDAGLGDPLERLLGLGVRLDGERAAMAADDPAGKTDLQRRVGDDAQRMGVRVIGLVDMEIEVEAALRSGKHHPLDQLVEVRNHEGGGA